MLVRTISEQVHCQYNVPMETRLLDLLVCPICKGRLYPDRQRAELVCRADRLAFPIRDGIPVMLESEARQLADTPSQAQSEQAPNTGNGSPQ